MKSFHSRWGMLSTSSYVRLIINPRNLFGNLPTSLFSLAYQNKKLFMEHKVAGIPEGLNQHQLRLRIKMKCFKCYKGQKMPVGIYCRKLGRYLIDIADMKTMSKDCNIEAILRKV
jgi:hypothetical protein